MSTNNKKNNMKLSIWSELSGASIGIGIGLLVLIIVAIAFYVFMNLSPAKKIKVDDSACRKAFGHEGYQCGNSYYPP